MLTACTHVTKVSPDPRDALTAPSALGFVPNLSILHSAPQASSHAGNTSESFG